MAAGKANWLAGVEAEAAEFRMDCGDARGGAIMDRWAAVAIASSPDIIVPLGVACSDCK